jgi:hypothetical protein
MVGMDGWCPSCGYSVEPGTRFCGGCGQQLAPADGAPASPYPTATGQSPGGPFQGQAGPASPLPAPPAAPPPVGSPASWPPPPGAPQPGQSTEPQAPLSDTMERMLRPQGLFQTRLPPPAEWPQPAYPPAPGGYPPPGGQPPPNPYQQGGGYPPPPPPAPYPPAGQQYPPTGTFQQPAPSPTWGAAPPGAGYPPDGQYPPTGAFQGPYGNGQFAGGQYGQEQFPGGQYPPGQSGPGVLYGPDGLPLGDGGADSQGLLGRLPLKRPRKMLIAASAGAAVLVVIVVAVLLSPGGGSSNAAGGTAAGATAAASASSGATALTQSQAATALSALLSQSGGDRADVGAAVVNVENCGKDLGQDAQVFDKAAANRRALLTKLGRLPGRSALPAGMVADLAGAWQASAAVDADLAKWATAEASHCQKGNTTKNPNYTATIPSDSQATNDKNAFVQLWNPLAKQDGLPARQSGDL